MDKAFHYRAHIILSGVQESTGCLGSCSLWVKEHCSYLEIWLDPGSLCVCVCLLWEVNILPGWWYVLLMTSGVYVARCSAFSGVQTGQNGGRSPVPVLQCSSPGFHLMVLCSCGWSCLAVLFHCGVCTAVIKKKHLLCHWRRHRGMEVLCLLWMPRPVYLPTCFHPSPAPARLWRVHCGAWSWLSGHECQRWKLQLVSRAWLSFLWRCQEPQHPLALIYTLQTRQSQGLLSEPTIENHDAVLGALCSAFSISENAL